MSWWRRIWCKHSWECEATILRRPLADRIEHLRGGTAEQVRELLYGSTYVVGTCSKCGDIREFRIAGNPE